MFKLPYAVLKFNQNLYNSQVPLFRAAMIEEVGREYELFHNHSESHNVKYPYTQYKVIHKKAPIVGLGPGCMHLHKTAQPGMKLRIGKEQKIFDIDSFEFAHHELGVNGLTHLYSLKTWMPLNQENFEKYKTAGSDLAKLKMLEKILKNQIVGTYYAIGGKSNEEVLVKIDRIKREKVLRFKGVLMHTFDLNFQSNVLLPDFIGLGKAAAMGFGSIMKFRKK